MILVAALFSIIAAEVPKEKILQSPGWLTVEAAHRSIKWANADPQNKRPREDLLLHVKEPELANKLSEDIPSDISPVRVNEEANVHLVTVKETRKSKTCVLTYRVELLPLEGKVKRWRIVSVSSQGDN